MLYTCFTPILHLFCTYYYTRFAAALHRETRQVAAIYTCFYSHFTPVLHRETRQVAVVGDSVFVGNALNPR